MVLQACPQTVTTNSAEVSNAAEMASTLDRYIEDLRAANKQAEETLLNDAADNLGTSSKKQKKLSQDQRGCSK